MVKRRKEPSLHRRVGRLVGWLVGSPVGWPEGWRVGIDGILVGRPDGWLVGAPVGWLVGGADPHVPLSVYDSAAQYVSGGHEVQYAFDSPQEFAGHEYTLHKDESAAYNVLPNTKENLLFLLEADSNSNALGPEPHINTFPSSYMAAKDSLIEKIATHLFLTSFDVIVTF